MKNKYLVTIVGRSRKWALYVRLTPEEAVNLSNDGVDIVLMIEPLPDFIQDIKDFFGWGKKRG